MRTRMKSLRIKSLWMLAGLMVPTTAALGCGAAVAALPALIITNTWGVQGQDRDFSFESLDDGQDHGSFVGVEFANNIEVDSLSGSWTSGNVRIEMYDGRVYTGAFTDLPDRLTVSSSTETLVLVRGG